LLNISSTFDWKVQAHCQKKVCYLKNSWNQTKKYWKNRAVGKPKKNWKILGGPLSCTCETDHTVSFPRLHGGAGQDELAVPENSWFKDV